MGSGSSKNKEKEDKTDVEGINTVNNLFSVINLHLNMVTYCGVSFLMVVVIIICFCLCLKKGLVCCTCQPATGGAYREK